MSSTVYVGTAVELTYTGTTGSTVTATWLDPTDTAVLSSVPVTETPAATGKWPYTFLVTEPGVWTARFTSAGSQTAVDNYYIRGLAADGPRPFATVGDVSETMGGLTTAQEGIATTLVRRASAMVRAVYTDVDTRIGAGTLDPTLAAEAVLNMVVRVLRNPGGLRSKSVGPFHETYDPAAAVGALQITPAEARLLTPVVRKTAATILVRPGLAPPPRGIHGRTPIGWPDWPGDAFGGRW